MKKKDMQNCIEEVLTHWKNYGRHDLPWRKAITPYKILVSEIMLQQTQVSRVIPKFLLWMKKYPTLTHLSRASLQEVLVLWQGLGYQRRAKALLSIAKQHTSLPKEYKALQELPSIGRYTASALCAFAYNTFGHPLLETNIRTALIEYFHKDEDVISDDVLYQDLEILESSSRVKSVGARTWYYALMDYGAYLKSHTISHNARVRGYTKQSAYSGSFRELRAKVLFAVTHNTTMPRDARVDDVLQKLVTEGYIEKKRGKYRIT